MANTRLLSKSRFKIGCECPTKLFFTGKSEYGDTKLDDPFLKALAKGGFQVGELAKHYYPAGTEVRSRRTAEAVAETNRLLEASDVTIYEAALQHGDYIVRVDVLKKSGHVIELIEVKSKSHEFGSDPDFFTLKGKLRSNWEPYLLDVAFQTHVARLCFPKADVKPFLMLADKSKTASVEGLNQVFFLRERKGERPEVIVDQVRLKQGLGEKILSALDVEEVVSRILSGHQLGGKSFAEYAQFLADLYKNDRRHEPELSKSCKSCEFWIDDKMKADGNKSGFEECWSRGAGLKADDFKRPLVFEIWNYRKSDDHIQDRRYFMDELTEEEFAPGKKDEPSVGLSSKARQWLQVQKVKSKDPTAFVDLQSLHEEMNQHRFPLHFIDFETTMVAIPFHKGRRPYEQVAFQFSHHIMQKDGTVAHQDQYIHFEQGAFPNFDFVRALKKSLEGDQGTIFRYSHHENTVLCQIHSQLENSAEENRIELQQFIESITHKKGSWEAGPRDMVDLCELVKKYYYHPLTAGSNSIKKVLPAILSDSQFLKEVYSKPTYGAKNGVRSLNFSDHAWLQLKADGSVEDPYKLLPPIFSGIRPEALDSFLNEDDDLADGGAAMMAYAKMQFTQMKEEERKLLRSALLRYCELDTFAMVMIYQAWQSLAGRKARAA